MDLVTLPGGFQLFNLKIASGARAALLGKGSGELLKGNRSLGILLSNFASVLRSQNDHEVEARASAVKVVPFLQQLVRLVVELRLEPVFAAQNAVEVADSEEDDSDVTPADFDWKWLLDAVLSVRALRALSSRFVLQHFCLGLTCPPPDFLQDF